MANFKFRNAWSDAAWTDARFRDLTEPVEPLADGAIGPELDAELADSPTDPPPAAPETGQHIVMKSCVH
jgi:hypothetical protein